MAIPAIAPRLNDPRPKPNTNTGESRYRWEKAANVIQRMAAKEMYPANTKTPIRAVCMDS